MTDETNRIHVITYPLSNSQMNIWNLEQSLQGTSVNNICETVHIKGRVDITLIQRCLNLVVENDPSVRLRLTMQDGRPMQYYAPYFAQQFPVLDFSSTNQEGVACWERTVTRETMPLLDLPLYYFAILKLNENEGGILIKTHHIISDGWSQVVFINRFAETYLRLLSGQEHNLTPLPPYHVHIEKEQQYLSSSAFARDKKFWDEQTSQMSQPLSFKDCQSAILSPVGHWRHFDFPEGISRAIYAFCTQNRVAPFAVFYMALAIYLNRVGGTDRFSIGVPIHNRLDVTERQTTGMFVSTMPFYGYLDNRWNLEQFNKALSEQWFNLLRHQRLPFDEIVKLAKKHHPETNALFHIVLDFQDSRFFASRDATVMFTGQWNYSGYQSEHLCIHLNNMDNGRRYSANYCYLAQLFSEDEIESIHTHLMKILYQVLASPQRPLNDINLLSSEEQDDVLFRFNKTDPIFLSDNLDRQFGEMVAQHPDRVVLIENNQRLTYRQLNEKVDSVAVAIQSVLSAPNQRVAVLLPKGNLIVEAMLGIIRSGNAWVLLPENLPVMRQEDIVAESNASLLITTHQLLEQTHVTLHDLPVVFISEVPRSKEKAVVPEMNHSTSAYIVFTSGSTGKPKGVEITHGNLLNFAASMTSIYPYGAVLSLCGVGFDVFIMESIVTLLNGHTVVFPKAEDTENPVALAKIIRDYAVGFISTTPSRLMAYIKYPEFARSLRRVEAIVCGGEAFPGQLLQTLKGWTAANVYNQYGPSETTIGVTYKLLNEASAITVGRPMTGCQLYVLDQYQKPLPVGVPGQVYIGGRNVGKGYYNQPDLTAKSFFDNPFEPGERMYASGDMGCWTPGGELILKGRADRQVKLRGFRIELDEIASRLSMHPAIHQSAAHVFEENGHQTLAAYYTSDKPLKESELLEFTATYLPEYMIPACFIRLAQIPLTGNGKLDISRLPSPRTEIAGLVPETNNQKRLIAIFQQVLKQPQITADSDYFLFGGDSLNALETLTLIEKETGVTLRVADLYACRTARKLEQRVYGINGSLPPVMEAIPPAPTCSSYPLLPIQQSIYVQWRLDPTGLAYNMPGALQLPAGIDKDRLILALGQLVQHEELLRTYFVPAENTICQKIAPSVPFAISVLQGNTLEEVAATFIRPFDLSQAPLLRAGIWEDPSGITTLLLDMHHIISDGMTTPILLKKIDALYKGQPLESKALQYKDYAYWYHHKPDAAVPEDQRKFWQGQAREFPAALDLPMDGSRSDRFDYKGQKHEFALDGRLTDLCRQYCKNTGATPFMLFAGTVGILLSRLSQNDDFLVGSPVSGRHRQELRDMAGTLINTLPLRLNPKGENTIASYFESVRQQVILILDNQDVPFEEIVSMASIKRSLSRNPLYDVLVSFRPVSDKDMMLNGIQLAYIPLETDTAKVELSWEGYEKNGRFSFCIEYASQLFAQDTIALYKRSFESLLRQIVSRPQDVRLDELSCLAPADQVLLWEKPNHMRTPFVDLPIDKQIDFMAQLSPDAPAIHFHNKTMTYGQLKGRSDALAMQIIQSGAKHGDIIGILCRRSPDLLCAMIGVNKAGCAYLPLLASYPQPRLHYMLENAKAFMVLCDAQTREELSSYELPCPLAALCTDPEAPYFMPIPDRSTKDLIHVLYTSGSTGKPKGVMLAHSTTANLLGALTQLLSTPAGNVLCTTNIVFDTFITEGLLPLALGKCVIMADEEEMMLPYKMAELIESKDITIMQLTPSRLQMCLGNKAFFKAMRRIQVIILVGEALSNQLLFDLQSTGCQGIFNLYGPTEAAVYITMTNLTKAEKVTIGTPLANCRVYILDKNLKPVMPTAIGELYLAGTCLANGYINQPELTAAAFVDDPFFPGEKMYRSGDIGRMLPNGDILYLGRRDSQVKINGQRIELSEITGAITGSDMVAEAVLVPIKQPDGNTILSAFIVPKENAAFDLTLLKKYMGSQLPQVMIPAQFTIVEMLPKTASGKADIQTLISKQSGQATAAAPALSAKETSSVPAEPAIPKEDVKPAPVAKPFVIQTETPVEQPVSVTIQAAPEIKPVAVTFQAVSEVKPASIVVPAVPIAKQVPDIAPVPPEANPAPSQTPQVIPMVSSVLHEQLLLLWKETLHTDIIQENISFFEQGGSSLSALNLLSQYFNHGWTMTLAQFYENPTVAAQTLLLEESIAHSVVPMEATEPKTVSAQIQPPVSNAPPETVAILSRLVLQNPNIPGAVFLTGATGFLGAHLLKKLIESGKSPIVCLVRGGNAPRLNDTLCWYFGQDWTAAHWNSIQVVPGDISLQRFGMDQDTYDALAKRIGIIIHAAADVRHYTNDSSSLDTNYQGTANMIAFAWASSASLMHVSTISVCGEYIKNNPSAKAVFTEDCRDIGQNWQDNVYIRGKFQGEQLVFSAIQEGLDAKIFRVGRLVGRDQDGVFQQRTDCNAFYQFMRGLSFLDMLPRSLAEFPVEMTPVDYCAAAIVALMDSRETVYHLCQPKPATLDEIAAAVKGYSIPLTSEDVFERHLNQLLREGFSPQISMMLEVYNRIKLRPVNIEPDCTKTEQALERVGLNWPKSNIQKWLKSFLHEGNPFVNPLGHITAT